MKSKYKKYRDDILELYHDNNIISYSNIALKISKKYNLPLVSQGRAARGFRTYVGFVVKGLPIDIPSPKMKTIKESYNGSGEMTHQTKKLVGKPIKHPANHEIIRVSTNKSTGQQWVITKPKVETPENDGFDYIGELRKGLDGYIPILSSVDIDSDVEGVLSIADLHFGAYISSMKINPDFNITILCSMLERSAKRINKFGYKKVHVHLLGDLIESFTGLNHKNSWKGLDKGMFGVSAIKLFVELFSKHLLERINNLGSVKIIAGNHDRLTSDVNEDVDGGAAELIAWGLEMLNYDIEFSASIITHRVNGINYILNHGHLYLTKKKTTEEICWMYGEKGYFNYIMEAHLHSRIAKLNSKQASNFKMLMDDTVDTRRQVCPSMFTGNSYSENGGWSTTPGFLITEDNGSGKPNVFDFSL